MLENILKKRNKSNDSTQDTFKQMVEGMPIGVMLLDLETFEITYANKFSIEALRGIQNVLPVPAEQIVGQCVDIFHKNPAHQRALLRDPSRLPFDTRITVGTEKLDLLVTALRDPNGAYVGPMLTWTVVTAEARNEEETARLVAMLEGIGASQAMIEFELDGTIITANENFLNALGYQLSEIEGKHHSLFVDANYRESPEYRAFWEDLGSGKFQANEFLRKHKDGRDVWIQAAYNPVFGPDGKPYKVVKNAVDITEKKLASLQMSETVSSVSTAVSAAATEMQSSAGAMSTTAETTNESASVVASACEELNTSIAEISQRVNQSSEMARAGVQEAQSSSETINGLASTAEEIGTVVNIIQDIAEQTNLLALNATIEAARAGEAGKGFAVVAAEVKSLANQTAKATEEISKQIGQIQGATQSAVTANDTVSGMISEIEEVVTAIAAAVEEQTAATAEMNRNILSVSQASSETGNVAGDVHQAASELSERANELEVQVGEFMKATAS